MIVVYDPSCCFGICFIWSIHVVDLHNICDSGRVRSFRGMWLWPLMAVHFVDLYNFMNWFGPFFMCLGVLNVCRVHPLFFFLELYKSDPCWVRPLFGLYKFLTLGRVRPLSGLRISLWPLVVSVHFVDFAYVFNPWWGLSTLWTLYINF